MVLFCYFWLMYILYRLEIKWIREWKGKKNVGRVVVGNFEYLNRKFVRILII